MAARPEVFETAEAPEVVVAALHDALVIAQENGGDLTPSQIRAIEAALEMACDYLMDPSVERPPGNPQALREAFRFKRTGKVRRNGVAV